MDPQSVYRKSARGSQAIGARLHGLVGRARSLLILIDGKRGHADLHALAGGFCDVAQTLAELERDGFIEPVPGAVAVPLAAPATQATAAPAPVTAAAPAPGTAAITLAQTKAFTCRRLIELLGPTAVAMCQKVEATRTLAEFVPEVQRAYAVVREVRGQAAAASFGAAIEANLPTA